MRVPLGGSRERKLRDSDGEGRHRESLGDQVGRRTKGNAADSFRRAPPEQGLLSDEGTCTGDRIRDEA